MGPTAPRMGGLMANEFVNLWEGREVNSWGSPEAPLIDAETIPWNAAPYDESRGRKWVVVFRKTRNGGSIAIVRNFYVHGMKSYGWRNRKKIIVTEARGIPKALFLDMIDAALRQAERMNEIETNKMRRD